MEVWRYVCIKRGKVDLKKCSLFVDIVGDKEDNEYKWQIVK